MNGASDHLARALGYPYDAHHDDFLFRAGEALPLAPGHPLDDLTPVIAVGSNRAPAQLTRKFAGMEVAVPVTRLQARDVDVVHAAHLAGYGSVPATLAASPGTVTELWITWLDRAGLERMDATEAVGVNYDRVTVALGLGRGRAACPRAGAAVHGAPRADAPGRLAGGARLDPGDRPPAPRRCTKRRSCAGCTPCAGRGDSRIGWRG